MAENKERLLLFDLLRITGILLVVLCHIGIFCGYSLLSNCVNIFDIFFIGAGTVGVGIFLLVSGSVLEYNHGDIKLENYFEFVKKRLLRVYPAYWMSLIFASLFVSFVYKSKLCMGYSYLVFGVHGFYWQMGGPYK